jgi:hypothetical protein
MDSILFHFPDARSAFLAFDTLEELGYEPVIEAERVPPSVHVHLHKCDITSALEIAQACGGRLADQQPMAETSLYDDAYLTQNREDEIEIPAHIVTEDFSEDYMRGDSFSADIRA